VVNKDMAGTKVAEFEFPVERGKIKEFASAICDPNPVYRDREYARRKGFDDVLMPVTFIAAFQHHMGLENRDEVSRKLGMDPARSIHGETEMFFQRPVCAGECLRGEMHVGEIYEKEGKRGGTMTFVEMEIRLYDAEDNPVVVMRNIHIERG
jgi:peroxisomal enoyl-CoA hydratase 2